MNTFVDILVTRLLTNFFVQVAYAQPATPTTGIPTGITTAQGFVNLLGIVTDWIFVLLLIVAVIFFILAGLQFIAGGGNATAISGARTKILYGVIGIVVALLARGFPFVVENIIGQNSAPLPPVVKRVFVTSTLQNGNLGGLAGGDSICAARASAAGLGGSWRAWLSTSAVNARDRIPDAIYERVDGARIADDKADLLDGSIANPINVDENGNTLGGPSVLPWTGTRADGTVSTQHCSGWTSAAFGIPGGIVGRGINNNSWWTDFGPATCSGSRQLYCFEQ